MGFLKRLGYFIFGLSIGIVFLTFFFKKKSDETGVSFCYFPNCRTLKDIRSKPVVYSNEVSSLLANKQLDTLDIKLLLTNGDIDFGKSNTKSVPCRTYIVEGTIKNQPATITVKNCPNKTRIDKIER